MTTYRRQKTVEAQNAPGRLPIASTVVRVERDPSATTGNTDNFSVIASSAYTTGVHRILRVSSNSKMFSPAHVFGYTGTNPTQVFPDHEAARVASVKILQDLQQKQET